MHTSQHRYEASWPSNRVKKVSKHCVAMRSKACKNRAQASTAGALRSIAGAGKGFDYLSPPQTRNTKPMFLKGFFCGRYSRVAIAHRSLTNSQRTYPLSLQQFLTQRSGSSTTQREQHHRNKANRNLGCAQRRYRRELQHRHQPGGDRGGAHGQEAEQCGGQARFLAKGAHGDGRAQRVGEAHAPEKYHHRDRVPAQARVVWPD